MRDIVQQPCASALSRKRTLEAEWDLAIERLVAAHKCYFSDRDDEEFVDFNEAIDAFTDAQMALDEGIGKRASEREGCAIERLIAAWSGDDLNELNAAADAVATLFSPRRSSF